jgi:hypothetical protein
MAKLRAALLVCVRTRIRISVRRKENNRKRKMN